MTDILVIALGILASIILIASGLTTKRTKLLILLGSLSILGLAQYLILGAPIALAITTVTLTRYIMLLLFEKKYPIVTSGLVAALFMSMHLAAFSIATHSFTMELTVFDYIPLAGAFLGTLAFVFKNMIVVKSLMLAIGSMWLGYEFFIGAYGQMLGEMFTMGANIVAIVYLVKQRATGLTDEQIPDLNTQVIQTITTPIDLITTPIDMKPVLAALTQPIPVVKNKEQQQEAY